MLPDENNGQSVESEQNILPADVVDASEAHEDGSSEIPDEQAQAEGDKKPEADSSEKRPNRRERQLERERQANAELRAEIERLRAGKQSQGVDAEPKLEDFDDAIEWSKAQAKWEAKQALEVYKAEQQKQVQQAQLQELIAEHEEREEAYFESVPDYEEKVTALLQSGYVTPEIQVAVLHSDMSPQLAYYFANYTDGQQDLMALQSIKNNPAALRQAISKIEAYVKQHSGTAVKTTKAAPPINPPKSNVGGNSKDFASMSQKEMDKYWAPIK